MVSFDERLEVVRETIYSPFGYYLIENNAKWLFKELEVWKQVAYDRYNDWEKVELENKRLREALQGLLTADSCFKGTMVSRIYAMRDIAKSALEETK